jgi:hypothetical protein
MPGLNNTIHQTTVAGQVYRRGVSNTAHNYVALTMNNYSYLRRIARFDTALTFLKK